MKRILGLSTALMMLLFAACSPEQKADAPKNAVAENTSGTYEMTWTFNHHPLRYFERAANSFKAKVEERSGGKMKVNIRGEEMTSSEATSRNTRDALTKVSQGEVEMAQVFTSFLAESNHPAFYLFDLPYLFEDHEHFDAFTESKQAKMILENVGNNAPFQALAYTYSGGFLSLFSSEKINSPDDMVVAKWSSRVWDAYYAQYKTVMIQRASLVGKRLNPDDYFRRGVANSIYTTATDGLEILFGRGDVGKNVPKYVYVDDKFMLATTLIINSNFLNSLPSDLQEIIKTAASEVAVEEREMVIADAKVSLKTLQRDHGVNVILPGTTREQKMADIAPAYEAYYKISPEHKKLIEDIRSLGRSAKGAVISRN